MLKTILRFDLNASHTCTFLRSNSNFLTVYRNSLTVRKTRRIYAHTDIRVAVSLLHYTLRFENGQAPVCENTRTLVMYSLDLSQYVFRNVFNALSRITVFQTLHTHIIIIITRACKRTPHARIVGPTRRSQ